MPYVRVFVAEFMWQRIKNLFLSFRAYGVLSPDLRVRQQVNHRLSDRPSLTFQQWFDQHWKPLGIAPAIAQFAYARFEKYSGLSFSHVVPEDRLEELQWTRVCWYDWEMTLCDDFLQVFGVDVSDEFEDTPIDRISDLVRLLNHQAALARKV